jgi:hypothetical protein
VGAGDPGAVITILINFFRERPGMPVLEKRHVNPGTFCMHEMHRGTRVAFQHSATSTCKKYRCTIDFGTASNRKIMKNMTRVRT